MQTNIQRLFKHALQKTRISQRELLNLTKRARMLAPAIKPVQAFTNNLELHRDQIRRGHSEINVSTIINDINQLQNSMRLYDENKTVFDDVFQSEKKIEMKAYCTSIALYGVGGYIDMDNIPYFQVNWGDIHHKYANIAQVNQADLEKMFAATDEEKDSLSAIYVLLKLYAHLFKGKRVQIYIDNLAVIYMLKDYEAKKDKPHLQSIITKIANICMESKINPTWSRIGGVQLITADRLARFTMNPFQYASFTSQAKADAMACHHLNALIDEENKAE